MRHFLLLFAIAILLGCTQTKTSKYNTYRDITVKTDSLYIIAQVFVESAKVIPQDKLRYYWYSNGAILSNIGGYSGNLLNGTYRALSKDNKLVEQGFFVNGLKDGTWKFWYSNGNLQRKEIWKKGILKSIPVEFDYEGNLLHEQQTEQNVEMEITNPDSVAAIKPWYKRLFMKNRLRNE